MADPDLRYVEFNGTRLACRFRTGRSPTLLFLPGYASDMEGTKALALDSFAEARGLGMLRFDYSGTGSSEGEFEQARLGGWLDQTLHLLDTLTAGPVILVGSSMGGWIALLIAKHRPDRISALVGIASAPDFTDWGYSDREKRILRESGRLEQSNPYGVEPQVTNFGFWESGEALRLLHQPIAVGCPVRLVHGDSDNDVPVSVAVKTMRQLRSADVQLLVVKGGDHRLSAPRQIDAILGTVAGLLETAA